MLIERFRVKLRSRGSRGLIGLARQFKIMDDNNSGTLDPNEFVKAISDFGIEVDQKDIATVFKCFDTNGDGEINFHEFIRAIVGPLNNYRQQVVLKAFKSIDYNGDGVLTVDDIKRSYNASMHPDVKSGKRTEDEILTEFLETFEQHYNTLHKTKCDGKVTPDEFIEYYTNVSANIDSDAYFELMMSNVWNLECRNNPASMPYAGSSAKITTVSSRDAYRHDHHRNLFGTDKSTPFDKKQNTEWKTANNQSYSYRGNGRDIPAAGGIQNAAADPKMQFMTESQRMSGADYRGIQKADNDLVALFREKLAQRGARGPLGMQRIFKVMDDNNSHTLEIQEFWKAICDFRLQISPEECRKLFDLFDLNGDGEISYDELLRSVVGEMNPMRKEFVSRAFKKIDRDGSGVLDMSDIKKTYNAKMHPDVKAGKKTEDEVLAEFLDTFELHHSLKNPGDRDGKVTLSEF